MLDTGRPLVVSVPLPPSTNHAYVNVPGEGRVLSKKGRSYKRLVQQILMTERHEAPNGPHELELWLLFPDTNRRDAGNHLKLIEDAVADYFGYDDESHLVVHLYKGLDRLRPRAVLKLVSKTRPIPTPPDMPEVRE